MSALTLPKLPVAPPAEITFNIGSTDTTNSGDSSDTTQSNLVSACVCDLNKDRTVDSADLGTLLGSFGLCQSGDPGDFNFDAAIDSSDLGTMLGNFGQCPSDLAWATVLQWNPDPDVVLDADVRANIVASGYPWRVLDTGTGIEMLLIPGGTFSMGEEGWAGPVHTVTLTKAFYLGKTEVTQAQWQAKMDSNPSRFKNDLDSASRPVEGVTWNDTASFSTITGLRLATEAEWEYACRGEKQLHFTACPATQTAPTMTVYLETLRGTTAIQEAQHTPLAAKIPMRLGFTICWAMWRNGAMIGMALTITAQVHLLTQSGL